MIIELLLNIVYGLLSILTVAMKFPQMPGKVVEVVATALDYITSGISIASTYIDIPYLLILFAGIASIDIAVNLYHIVMWILRKIPILGIK